MSKDLVPRRLPITGSPHGVRATLEAHYRQDRLVSKPHEIKLQRHRDGTVTATAVLLVEQEVPWRKRHHVLAVILPVAAGFALLWGALVLAFHVVKAVFADPAVRIGGFLVVAAIVILAVLANRSRHRGACPGIVIHCSGCRH